MLSLILANGNFKTMKRKSQQEREVLKTPKSSSSTSSYVLFVDGNNCDESSTKSIPHTAEKCCINDTNTPVIKIEKADTDCEEKPKLANQKITSKKSISSSSSSENVQILQKSKPRIQLKAQKQRTSKKPEKTEPEVVKKKQEITFIVKEEKDSKDTMQMKLLREKIKLRQSQGNAPKKSKIIKEIEIKKEPSLAISKKGIRKKNTKLRKNDNHTDLISRKIKKELIDIENQSNGSKNSTKINRLKNTIKQRDQKMVDPDKKLTTTRPKENITRVADKESFVHVKNEPDGVNTDRSSLGLSVSSSSDSKLFSESSKYVIPKIKKSPKIYNNSNPTAKVIEDSQPNELLSASSSPKVEIQYYKNAEARMEALRNRLSSEIAIKKACKAPASNNVSHESNANDFYEEMEWEPIEEEKIIYQAQAIRAQLGICENEVQMKELSYTNNELIVTTNQADTNVIYVVIDTNVLLSSIETVEKLRDTSFGVHGKPTIIIPYIVIRELDYIKDDKKNISTESLKRNARRAVNFLHDHFSKKHPQVKGQKPQDSVNNREYFAIECPDDEILQTCLHIQSSNSFVFLLSFDKNLGNKAMIYDLVVLGKDDLIEKINKTLNQVNNKNKRGRKKIENVAIKEEITTEEEDIKVPCSFSTFSESEHSSSNIEDIYEETKEVLTTFLTVVVSSEMKNIYGDTWEKLTTAKLPWTVITVLECAVKNFLAVLSESFSSEAKPILRILLQLITKLESTVSRQLKDIQYIIELFNDLIQYVNNVNNYEHILRRSGTAIQQLRNKCIERLREQTAVGNRNAGMNLTEEEQKIRASRALECFENIYRFTRNFCGSALEIAGVPCSFQFNKLDLNDEFIRINCPDIAINLNQIIQALSYILENLSELHINHIFVIELYERIKNFLQRITDEPISDQLSSEDIYYCLKNGKEHFSLGFTQFVELSNHFSRITQFNSGQ